MDMSLKFKYALFLPLRHGALAVYVIIIITKIGWQHHMQNSNHLI